MVSPILLTLINQLCITTNSLWVSVQSEKLSLCVITFRVQFIENSFAITSHFFKEISPLESICILNTSLLIFFFSQLSQYFPRKFPHKSVFDRHAMFWLWWIYCAISCIPNAPIQVDFTSLNPRILFSLQITFSRMPNLCRDFRFIFPFWFSFSSNGKKNGSQNVCDKSVCVRVLFECEIHIVSWI